MQEKISARFEETLDIRSFVSVRTNLAILLSLLMSKEQMILYQLNENHCILETTKKKKKKSGEGH